MRIMRWVAGCCVLASIFCPVSRAQELKVGYVKLTQVFDSYDRTRAFDAQLEKKGKEKEGELEGRMNELKKLRSNLELLSPEAREAKTREIEERADELQRFRSGTARDLQRERDKIAKDILKEIQAAIEQVAKTGGYSIVLDERSLLYSESSQNLTDDVLKLLNSRYGSKKP